LSSNEDDEDFIMNFVTKGKTPFHISKEGIAEGYGKKINPFSKTSQFTVC
jgi:hypothetical protein